MKRPRRTTSIAAANVGITNRGRIAPGMFADLVLLDTAALADRATPKEPHLTATGVRGVGEWGAGLQWRCDWGVPGAGDPPGQGPRPRREAGPRGEDTQGVARLRLCENEERDCGPHVGRRCGDRVPRDHQSS